LENGGRFIDSDLWKKLAEKDRSVPLAAQQEAAKGPREEDLRDLLKCLESLAINGQLQESQRFAINRGGLRQRGNAFMRVALAGLAAAGLFGLTANAQSRNRGVNEDGPRPAHAFRILIDVNQLNPDEAAQASRFKADGIWAITHNSPAGIDWRKLFGVLAAAEWAVSEDDPAETREVDFVSNSVGRVADNAVFYNEDGLATPLRDEQIAAFATHAIPGHSSIGSRIILLTRSWGDGDERQAELNHGLANSKVAGAAFEFNPGDSIDPSWKLREGCLYILSVHKKCYLLMPPNDKTHDYLGDVQKAIAYFAQSGGLLNDPNVFVVLATYGRPNATHYLSTNSRDRNSIEAIAGWLKTYRLNPPRMADRPPRGALDSAANCDHVMGWAADEDTPFTPALVHFYVDGPAGSGILAGVKAANMRRPDLCTAIGSCDHGFVWSVPPQFRDGRRHRLYAYGIDTTVVDRNNTLLSGAYKTFRCER